MKAMDLFLRQRRFDLVFKYLYVRNGGKGFAREAYLESIRRFNGFEEFDLADNLVKSGESDFVNAFDALVESVRENGFLPEKGVIPVDESGNVCNGAHRLSVCAALGIEDIPVSRESGPMLMFDWKFFADAGLGQVYRDYGALEYVKLNHAAHIVNLHSVADPALDDKVREILGRYGFIYYEKSVKLSFSGCVNLKKISYGSFWERGSWIGSARDGFSGAQEHARESMQGGNPLRVFVFVCDRHEDVVSAKAEIRALYGLGNTTVHINDTHEEAVWLAEAYFNENSLKMLNLRSFRFEDARFDALVDALKSKAAECGVPVDSLCGAGSSPLDVVGARKSDDLDYLCTADSFDLHEEDISCHDGQLDFYPRTKADIIGDPRLHFYYRGMKFISLEVLRDMKRKRNEQPKDVRDVETIEAILRGENLKRLLDPGWLLRRICGWIYSKERIGPVRNVTLLGMKFSYVSRRRRNARPHPVLAAKYDLICPIGQCCAVALFLRKYGLRSMSLPFDWMLGDALDIGKYVDIVMSGFNRFMRPEALERLGPDGEFEKYRDCGTGLVSMHDFKRALPFDEAMPLVAAKFRRRIARFFSAVENSRKTLFVHFARSYHPSAEDLVAGLERLRERFPDRDLSLLVLEHCDEQDGTAGEEVADGIYVVRGRFWVYDMDHRYGNKELGCRVYSQLRVRGRWLNRLRGQIERYRMRMATMFHLTSEGRRQARQRYFDRHTREGE